MYAIGLVTAPLVAWCLKSSLLRGETPAFVMEMPLYKWPAWRTVVQRMTGAAWMFVRRAGTMILATMILVWALLYFPASHPDGGTYEERIDNVEHTSVMRSKDGKLVCWSINEQRERLEQLENDPDADEAEVKEIRDFLAPFDDQQNQLRREWSEQSILGRMGKWI